MTKSSKSPVSKEVVIAFVLDKSCSMSSIEDSTRSGFNEYIDTLKKDKKSKYKMSLTVFDTVVKKVYADKKLSDVPELTKENYVPTGMTALYDAVMQTITEVEKSAKKKQPVLITILTDGEENSSKEYSEKELHRAITRLQKQGNWTFVFLGANQDSWLMGKKLGLPAQNVANFNASGLGAQSAFYAVATNTRSYASSLSGQSAGSANFFSKKDQEDLENKK